MAYRRGEFSYKGSFLREETLTQPCITTQEDRKVLTKLFERNKDFTLKHSRGVISKVLDSMGMEGHMLFNAPNLAEIQDWNTLRAELEEMSEFLVNDLGLRGILEFHNGKDERGNYIDQTVNSSHIHFWGDMQQDNQYNRNAIAQYLIDKEFAYENLVHIQSYSAGKAIPEDELYPVLEEKQIGVELLQKPQIEEEVSYIEDEEALLLQKQMNDFLAMLEEDEQRERILDSQEEFAVGMSEETEASLSDIDAQLQELEKYSLSDEDFIFRA